MKIYDEEGYDKQGFNRNGIHKETGTRYNIKGFDRRGIHKKTRNRFDEEGYNINGYDERGRDRDGWYYGMYDKEGYDKQGFNRNGIHKETGDKYNEEGYDIFGIDREGYNRQGFNIDDINKETGTKYDQNGYDRYGYDKEGYDFEGYDKNGYDKDGYDKKGYDRMRFDRDGINKITKTLYDKDGYNRHGYDKDGYDRDGYNKEGYDRQGFSRVGMHKETETRYDLEGYDKEGYNIKGYDRSGYDKNGIDKQGNNRDGKKDKRITFAEEFIAYGKSIEQFAKEKQMDPAIVKARIEEIRTSPCVKAEIDKTLADNSNRYMGKIRTTKEQLLTGQKTIRDVNGINEILRICSQEESKQIIDTLIRAMVSHEISILDYKSIFGIENIDASLPQKIIMEIEKNKRYAGKLARELYKEIDRVKGYKAPYKPNEKEKLGFFANPGDKEPVIFMVTDKEREMAREYLRATNEFICNKTMQITLMKIAKGELDLEKIERAKKEGQLRNLQREDRELSEVIEMAAQLIGENERSGEETADIDDKR